MTNTQFIEKAVNQINEHLSPKEIVGSTHINFSGQFERFNTKKHGDKAGWVISSELEANKSDKDKFFICTYGDWKSDYKNAVKSWDVEDEKSWTPNKKNKLYKSIKKHEEKIKTETAKKNDEAAIKAKKIWENHRISNEIHSYMKCRGFSQPHIERTVPWDEITNALIIPIINFEGEIRSLQYIWEKEDGFGKKFMSGGQVNGCFTLINGMVKDLASADTILLAEGYATALSCYRAMNIPTMAAMSLGNLKNVVSRLKGINPKAHIIICCDDDENQKAMEKAKTIKKDYENKYFTIEIALPRFKNPSKDNNDFNDLMNESGLEEVKKQILEKIVEKPFLKGQVKALGISKSNIYHYISSEGNRIIPLRGDQHKPDFLRDLMPTEYWVANFPRTDPKNPTIVTADWVQAQDHLKDMSRSLGTYSPEKIKGTGIFKDGKGLVVNTGNELFVANYNDLELEYKRYSYSDPELKTNFIYEADSKDENLKICRKNMLSEQDIDKILQFFDLYKFDNNSSKYALLGWLITSQLMMILKWRPILWINAEAGSGKSTLIEMMSKLIRFKAPLTNDFTAAGITQAVGNSAWAVFLDESESKNERRKEKMREILEMLRSTSTNNQAKRMRGTPHGSTRLSGIDISACLSSVNAPEGEVADSSRITFVNLQSLPSCPDEIIKNETFIEEFGEYIEKNNIQEKFLNTVLFGAREIQEITELTKKIFLRKLPGLITNASKITRLASQLSAQYGPYLYALHKEKLTTDEIERFIDELNIGESDYIENNEETESAKCLRTIFEIMIRVKDENYSIGQVIRRLTNPSIQEMDDVTDYWKRDSIKVLDQHGLKVVSKSIEKGGGYTLFIPNALNNNLKIKLARYDFNSNYVKLLKTYPNVNKRATQKMEGRVKKGIEINI